MQKPPPLITEEGITYPVSHPTLGMGACPACPCHGAPASSYPPLPACPPWCSGVCCPCHAHPAQHGHHWHQLWAAESSPKTPLLSHRSALFLSHRSISKKSLPTPAACLPPFPLLPLYALYALTLNSPLSWNMWTTVWEGELSCFLSALPSTLLLHGPSTAAPWYHLHRPCCLQGAIGHPYPPTTTETPWRWLLVLPLPHPPARAA